MVSGSACSERGGWYVPNVYLIRLGAWLRKGGEEGEDERGELLVGEAA